MICGYSCVKKLLEIFRIQQGKRSQQRIARIAVPVFGSHSTRSGRQRLEGDRFGIHREQRGTLAFDKVDPLIRQGEDSNDRVRLIAGEPSGEQVLAVLVEGTADTKKESESKEGESAEAAAASKAAPVRAIYVADADCMSAVFVDIRNRPDQYEDFNFRLQNVPFVLNIVDVLAGEEEYPKVRRHEPQTARWCWSSKKPKRLAGKSRKSVKSFAPATTRPSKTLKPI